MVISDDSTGGADPERSIASLVQTTNFIAEKSFIVFRRKGGETDAVETSQAPIRSDPKIAVARLANRQHGIVRQALVDRKRSRTVSRCLRIGRTRFCAQRRER